MQISTAGRRRLGGKSGKNLLSNFAMMVFHISFSANRASPKICQTTPSSRGRTVERHHKWTEKSEAKKALLVTSGNAVNPAGT